MSSLAGLVGAVEYGGPWELPPIRELFEFAPIWEFSLFGVDLSINRTVLMLLLSAVILGAVFALVFNNPGVIPNKAQAAAEGVITFIREQIAIEIIGPEGRRFVPLLTTIFVFIFLNNLFKITPFLMLPPTSRIGIPGFLAIISLLVFVGVGIQHHGLVGYFKGIAFPSGVPKPLYIILTPIEIASNLILRPFTLAIRLFANMVAGHILVVITLITIHAFLAWGPGLPVGIFALIASPLVFGFEFFIISLQAYIFTMLTAVYISSSMEAH